MSPRAPLLALVVVGAACGSHHDYNPQGTTLPAHPDGLEAMPIAPPPEERPAPSAPAASASAAPAAEPPGSAPVEGVPPFTSAPARYTVEPGGRYASLAAVAPILKAGDIVDVVGDATYAGGVRFENAGTQFAKIVIRGVPKNGRLPRIAGGDNTIEAAGDHYVFEGLDISGGARRCFFHHADDVTLRLSRVHDCPEQGILGADTDSGSMLLEFTEVHHAGGGVYHHPIYMATDEKRHPGSVFKMQFCWVHDGNGGNNVKSRAERNEILYNWIEGAMYHELELIGPDGQDPKLAREDSQLVGNVILKQNDFFAIRLGGDGTGATGGRYRFVGNTIITGGSPAIRAFDSLESVELFENVFYRRDGSAVALFVDAEADWVDGAPVFTGVRNWFTTGSKVPRTLEATRFGGAPGFASLLDKNLRPSATSSVATAPSGSNATDSARPLKNPILTAAFEPPAGKLGPARARKVPRASLGAFDP